MTALQTLTINVEKVNTKLDESTSKENVSCDSNSNSPTNILTEEQYAQYIEDIRSSKNVSMKILLGNPLVKDIFDIEECEDQTGQNCWFVLLVKSGE